MAGERAEDILARVAQARASGIAHAPAGLMPGTSAVALPIRAEGGEPLGAVTVTAMAERLAGGRLAQVVERMRDRAQAIARRHAEVSERRR
ncbi:IclR family transcriptional regulator C-terminal domain-containing protein [Achromobacter xylosoxidans]